jgi:hypothetical protein
MGEQFEHHLQVFQIEGLGETVAGKDAGEPFADLDQRGQRIDNAKVSQRSA